MKVLDLFSGIGGFSLGLERAGMETVAFCEIEEFPRKVLRKHWPDVPIFEDVRKLKGSDVGPVDVICGGFPCQDISIAGKGGGLQGHRSGLWIEFLRLTQELRPRFIIVENSKFLISRGLHSVLRDLAKIGYDAEWHCIPASHAGARHFRDRCWIVAYPSLHRPVRWGSGWPRTQEEYERLGCGELWERRPKPLPVGVLDGVSDRVDRIGCLGNAVVPQIPEMIGRAIMAAESQHA